MTDIVEQIAQHTGMPTITQARMVHNGITQLYAKHRLQGICSLEECAWAFEEVCLFADSEKEEILTRMLAGERTLMRQFLQELSIAFIAIN